MLHSIYYSKAFQKGDILKKIIRRNRDLPSEFINASFNNGLYKGVFPDQLKNVPAKSVSKKISRNDKENYRPVSILPNL